MQAKPISANPLRVAAEASYIDLFDRLKDATFLVDKDTLKILDANPEAEKWFNLEGANLKSLDLTTLFIKEDDKEQFLKSMRIVARRYAPRECEVVWLVNQKELIIQLTACALNLNADAENIVLQIVAKDITELKESQRLLESKNKELEEMNKKLEEISITDALTNLFNRRHFDKALELEKSRSERMKHKFTILIMDIDKFKIYNDTNGHPAGDALLKEFSKVLKTCVRDTDLAARYGGEEFVVLCPETDSVQALVVAERIRSSMENHPFLHREKQPFGFVSVSIGLATFNEHGKASGHEIYEMADKALYEAKKQRNSIKVYST